MVKIIDKLNDKIAAGEPFFSFEYFPPKTDEGVANLRERQHRMAALGPTFCDITWGAGGSTADVTLDVARSMQQEVRGRPGSAIGWMGNGKIWMHNAERPAIGAQCQAPQVTKPTLAAPRHAVPRCATSCRAGGRGDDDASHLHQHACGEAAGSAGQGECVWCGGLGGATSCIAVSVPQPHMGCAGRTLPANQ